MQYCHMVVKTQLGRGHAWSATAVKKAIGIWNDERVGKLNADAYLGPKVPKYYFQSFTSC